MSKAELAQALNFEAQKYIPFALSEINLDSYILKPDLPDNKMLILMAAAKKDLVNQRLKLTQDAGIKAGIIDIDSLALINAFNFNYSQEEGLKNKTIALLNIGAAITNLNIVEGGIPYLSRDIQMGGNNFTQKIADTLDLDFNPAEELKLQPDDERFDKASGALEHLFTNLTNEIRISFDYYESQSASSVVKIFLSGGGSLLKGLRDSLAAILGIEVEYWDPFKKITIKEEVDSQKLKSQASQLSVALGLALRFNG
jgi:type IV pilus assembly protein PilM